MELKYGWICPLCGKALSPDTKACSCYKERKEEKITIKPAGPIPYKEGQIWIKDWPTPYDKQPKFNFYTSGSSDPCEGCPSKGKPFCHCTLGSMRITF